MQIAEVRAVQTPATLCNRLERHATAFILSMLKTNTAAWRLHSVLDSKLCNAVATLRVLLERRGRVVGALWARRVNAVKTPCKFCI